MANYNYATLTIPVNADTRPLITQVARAAQSAGDDAAQAISGNMAKGLGRIAAPAKAVGKAVVTGLGIATTAAAAFGVSAFRTAARVGEMDASLRALAKANRQSYPEMQRQVTAIRRTGIEAGVAQQVVAQFSRLNLRLADSSKLARVAQDAAVISGRNSTEVLNDIIHGVATQNTLVLRNAGINVQAGQAMAAYAKQLGKSQAELTASERAQAVLNAVMEEGTKVSGAYAAAMQEPGKVLRSFPRIFDDIKLSVGQGLVAAFGPVILKSYDLAKALSEAIQPGGKLAPMFDAIGDAAKRAAAPLVRLVELATAWVRNLSPSAIDKATGSVKRFGPAVAAAGAAAALFTGGGIVTKLPIIGDLFSALVGPVGSAAKAIGTSLLPVVGKVVPALAPVTGAITGGGGLTAALSAITGPVGLAVAAIGLMIAASPKLRGALLDIGKAFLGALKPVLSALWDALRPLVKVVMDLARQLGDALAPAIKQLAPLLGPVGQILGALIRVIGGVLGIVIKLLSPLLRLAVAFTALKIAYVIVPVMRAFAAVIQFVASWVERLVKWIFGGSPGLIPALQAIARPAQAAAKILSGVLAASFGAITRAAQAVWSFLSRNWPLLVGILTGPVGIAVVLITRNWDVIRRVTIAMWQAVSAAISAALAAISSAVATATSWTARTILAAWTTSWTWTVQRWQAIQRTITAVLNAIRSAVGAAMSWVTSRISAAWSAAWSNTASRWNQIRATITGALNGIRSATGSALSWVQSRISSAWNAIFNSTRTMWDRTVGAIKTAWDRVVGIVRAPVKTLVEKVVNPLINGINTLITKIGMTKLPTINLGFAAGGRVPGFGRGDKIPAMLEPGETVVTRRDSARPDFRAWAARRGIPGYYQGGIVTGEAASDLMKASPFGAFDFLGKGWNAIVGAGKKIVSEFGQLFRQGVAAAFELMTKPLRKVAEPFARSPELFREFFGRKIINIIDKAIEWIRGKEEADLGLGGVGVAALAAEVIKKFPSLRVTSALRPGDPGYHGKGWARDLGGPVGVMNAAGRWMSQTMTSALLEGIHNPSLSVKNYKTVPAGFWGSGTWAGHADHIHMAAPPAGPGGPSFSAGGMALRQIVDRIARQFGVPGMVNLALQRIGVESGFNARAVNNWDINAQRGYPSTGIAQIIRPTFQAYCGPYCGKGPFLNGVSLDPVAQVYTMFAYSISRYGRSGLARAWGGRQGYAHGGILREPVMGLGIRTGRPYSFGENAPAIPERWTPLDGTDGGGRIIVNVYPQRGQSETEIAAAVSRRLGWAQATGRA
jgi:phage-related protein